MTKMKLLNDICRCHDNTCDKHKKCERFLQRETAKGSATMRTNGECVYFIAGVKK